MVTIMIADDEAIEHEYLSFLFQQFPNSYQVIANATNGLETVELASKLHPDIIILDINMPILNGLEAARQIRLRNPQQIIILNSAYADFEYARSAIAYGVDAYLLKPSSQEEVFATITECLGKKYTPTPRMDLAANAYPHELADQIMTSIEQWDTAHFARTTGDLLTLLCDQQISFDLCKMYMIHTVLNTDNQLAKLNVSATLLALADCSSTLASITAASTTHSIRSSSEGYFKRVQLILESYSPAKDEIDFILSYIDEHYAEDITLNQLADLVHFSPSHLSRLFHAKTEMTLRTYLRKKRIDQALLLLRTTQKSTTDIAVECGFGNLSHFYRVFRTETGRTPTQIRTEKED